ncbi:MAG: DUF4388 domain-containing protein [Acidimicrobiia bacterium]
MALQGTLDTFALPDVLRLLASTNKSGRLAVEGDHGSGEVWLEGGAVVGAWAPGAGAGAGSAAVMFELLRNESGSFSFEPGAMSPAPAAAVAVEGLLAQAEVELEEWRAIEAVVPSLGSWVTMASELAVADVTVDADQWRVLACIGGGATVAAIGDALDLGEVAACRGVKELVELGLVDLGPVPAGTAAGWPGPRAPEDDGPSPGAVLEDDADADAYEPRYYERRVDDGYDDGDEYDDDPALSTAPDTGPAGTDDDDDADDYEADDVARQLASLSPEAARAVAAAAAATTDVEREAALAEVTDDHGGRLNRGLLLRFLSSAR